MKTNQILQLIFSCLLGIIVGRLLFNYYTIPEQINDNYIEVTK